MTLIQNARDNMHTIGAYLPEHENLREINPENNVYFLKPTRIVQYFCTDCIDISL